MLPRGLPGHGYPLGRQARGMGILGSRWVTQSWICPHAAPPLLHLYTIKLWPFSFALSGLFGFPSCLASYWPLGPQCKVHHFLIICTESHLPYCWPLTELKRDLFWFSPLWIIWWRQLYYWLLILHNLYKKLLSHWNSWSITVKQTCNKNGIKHKAHKIRKYMKIQYDTGKQNTRGYYYLSPFISRPVHLLLVSSYLTKF